MQISHLCVNHLRSPLGYDLREPSFSWIVRESVSERQEKARLQVFLGTDCVYDTGISTSLDSLGTELPLKLLPRTRYRWQVTVWGNRGDCGEAESFFETGKMEETWVGRWITPGERQNAVLEKRFTLAEAPESARMYITGLGLYRLFSTEAPLPTKC